MTMQEPTLDFDHVEIKTHAQAVADRGGFSSECPYDQGIAYDLWMNYFYNRIMWLMGESSE